MCFFPHIDTYPLSNTAMLDEYYILLNVHAKYAFIRPLNI
jgi:hypothetical protein